MTGKLLVTGASGQLGAAVLRHLIDTCKVPASTIVAGSRDTARLSALAERGVETRRVDFNDAGTLASAFSGVDRVIIISTDALDGEGTRLRQHLAAVAAAKSAGVGRIFYTSMPNPEGSKVTFAPDHLKTEEAIKASGLAYTIFRNGWYMENLFMALPAGNRQRPVVQLRRHRQDRPHRPRRHRQGNRGGYCRAGAGERDLHAHRPVAYTTDEIAAMTSKATGKPLSVVHLTDEQLAQGMAGAGVPAPYIPTFVSFDANTREGKIAMVTTDAATLSGAQPMSLESFLEASKAALLG
jgi:NAD(P)H dehydrogenase (quinone)